MLHIRVYGRWAVGEYLKKLEQIETLDHKAARYLVIEYDSLGGYLPPGLVSSLYNIAPYIEKYSQTFEGIYFVIHSQLYEIIKDVFLRLFRLENTYYVNSIEAMMAHSSSSKNDL